MTYARYNLKQKYVNGSPVEEYAIGSIIDPDTTFDDLEECNEGNQRPDVPIEGAVYQWIVVDGEYICDNNNKYFKEKQQISLDNGTSWSDTGLVRKGSLIESASADCGIAPIYRYSVVYGEYMCSRYEKYQKLVKEISYNNGQSWQVVQPEEYIMGALIERDSVDCGYVPEATYRYIVVQGEWFCSGYTKYAKERKQVSYDAGLTWDWVVPYEERQGSLIETDSTDCGYVPPTPPTPSTDYLTFVALEDGTFKTSMSKYYSLDDGATWTTLAANTNSPTVSAGSKILWKETLNPPVWSDGSGTFSSTGRFNVEGNAMSLVYGDNFRGQTDITHRHGIFKELFKNCTKLVSAENLILPATTLELSCYWGMFYGCTSLTTAPELPATTLADKCYLEMFYNCSSLTTAPALPATTLVQGCYEHMFYNCSSLTTAPALPATTLVEFCYDELFYGCTSLTTAPALPATTLTQSCYYGMFRGCRALTTAPDLPATTLADNCYEMMFYGCRALTTAPELPATTLTNGCYAFMFNGCTSLTTAPSILPATTLVTDCYYYMFNGCTALTTAPELPATTLANNCYYSMFSGCTSLTTAPELPATTLVNSCYYHMFWGCTSLNYIKCLATNISASNCTYYWVYDVAASGTFVKNASMTRWGRGNNGIPSGWSVQNA